MKPADIQDFGAAYTMLRATRFRVKLGANAQGSRLLVEGRDPYVDRKEMQELVDRFHDEFLNMMTNPKLLEVTAILKAMFGARFECFVKKGD